MNRIVRILMTRDGMSLDEAKELLAEAREEVNLHGADPEEVLKEYFCLEPDYFFDLLPGV